VAVTALRFCPAAFPTNVSHEGDAPMRFRLAAAAATSGGLYPPAGVAV